MKRCKWVTTDPLYIDYHDREWGLPVHDDRALFEMINLEGHQAGLSWITILKKRENYRRAFDQFDPETIIQYDENKLEQLMQDTGIIRNRRKILAVVENAKSVLRIQDEFGSFAEYIWRFVDGAPIVNHWNQSEDVPVSTPLSDRMSKELKKRGFKFIGSTICYSFMQAVGMVMDHTSDCDRYHELIKYHQMREVN